MLLGWYRRVGRIDQPVRGRHVPGGNFDNGQR